MLFFPGVCACVGGMRTVQRAQGLPIAIVEEIAYENGWITREQLMESAERYGKSRFEDASSRQFFLPVCPSPVVPDIRFPIFKCGNDVLIQLAT